MKAKNWLFEAAMEAGEMRIAVSGFIGVRKKTSPRTRVHLEASALLAICYLRLRQLEKAAPLIERVMADDKNIRSLTQRREFRRSIKKRFEREGALAALRGVGSEILNPAEIQELAGEALQAKSQDQIYADLGAVLPDEVLQHLIDIDQIARRALPEGELRYLPRPREVSRQGEVGRTVLGAFQAVLWRSLCNPESDVYKAWFKEGFGVVLNKKYIAAAVAASMAEFSIGLKALAVAATAMVIKFGIEVFCQRYKPEGVMEIRA